jgi:soluble lytic murein transglycosylase
MFQKIKLQYAFIVLLCFSTNLLKAEDIPFQVSYSPIEYQYGIALSHFLSELSLNKFSHGDLNKMIAYQKKAPSFAELQDSVERIKAIDQISDQDSFYKSCEPAIKTGKDYSESIIDRINMNLDKYCRYLFLNRLAGLSSSINFSTRDLNYLKDGSQFFVTGENHEELINFFKHFKSNTVESEKISKVIEQKYIDYKIRPPSELITQMKISLPFHAFLQKNINLDDKSSIVFQKEFQRITKESSVAIDKGDYALGLQLARSNHLFYTNNKSFISEEKAWQGLTQLAKSFYYKGKDEESRELFNSAKQIAPPSKHQETIYNLLWPAVINNDDKALCEIVQKNNMEKLFAELDPKIQFWIAQAFYKKGDHKKAFDLFAKIISTTPYSFYSILSLKVLALNDKGKENGQLVLAKLVNKNPITEYSMNHVSDTLIHSLRRIAIWQKLENDKLVKNEVRYIRSLKRDVVFTDAKIAEKISEVQCKDFLTLNLVRLLHSKKQFLSAFKIFQESLDQNSLTLNYKLIKYIFPLTYLDIIKKNSRNIDPLVILSLIRQESSFNPNANSPVGAMGLMQLMPATARRFNSHVRAKNLTTPEINIGIGVKYFRELLNRYDGNLIFALAAYNAGENRIDRWRKDVFRCDDPLAQIESIPFEETRNYVKLIYRNYFFYSLLAEKSILMTPLQDSFKISLKH